MIITYPFDCGDHAVNIPGSGLVDFRVHVVSSQDTQSAWMSNVELELAAITVLKADKPPTNDTVTLMAGNQFVKQRTCAQNMGVPLVETSEDNGHPLAFL